MGVGATRRPAERAARLDRDRSGTVTEVLRHVVLFAWKADASDVQVRGFADGLAALPARIPEIRSYRFGPDLGLAGGNDDFALVADFDDVEAYRRYAEHPAHRHLIAELLWPILGGRHAVQYEL